jgi:hypothetical protein
MTFRRAQPGDRLAFRAAEWNAVREMAQAYQQDRLNAQGSRVRVDDHFVYGRNDSGADLARWSVAGVSGLVFLPVDQGDAFGSPVVLTLVAPTVADHAQRFVVAVEPIAAGAIGKVALSGVTTARVLNPTNLLNPTHAALAADDTGPAYLAAATSGPVELIWIENAGTPGTPPPEPTNLAVIRFGSVGSATQAMRIKQVFADYLRCRTWDAASATEGASDIYVAKWESLRHDLTLLQRYYAGVTSFTAVDEQTIDVNGGSERWVVNPKHAVNQVIEAAPAATAVTLPGAGNEAVAWLDLNRAGCAWAELRQEEP